MTDHIAQLTILNACEDAVAFAEQFESLADAWDACQRPDWMLWLHDKELIVISDNDLRLFACDCVRYTPIGDGLTVWDLLTDEHSRNAVDVAERFANGEATREELDAAKAAAWAAAKAAAGGAAHAAGATAWAFQADLLRKRVGNPFKEARS